MVRLVRAVITDTYLLEKSKVTSVDCLDYRLLASYSETFADYSVTVARNVQKETLIPKGHQILLERAGALINMMYRDAVGAVLSRDMKLVSSTTKRFEESKKLLSQAESTITKAPRPLVNHLVCRLLLEKKKNKNSDDISELTQKR